MNAARPDAGAVVIALDVRRAQRRAALLAQVHGHAVRRARDAQPPRPALRVVGGSATGTEGEPGFTLERFLARARLVLASPQAHEPAPVLPLRRQA